ncbi:TIM barrel protein [Rhizobium cremeum]|uniref:TIM barrel protein n=1 Tax=Rhizobium cremeum TaxID=2813827 RepID=UPI001FD26EA2|nr:TIM barrel protein [Rhizobium cremeum]MCJ7997309.1 TIM barrel protein [Rhizobium cremeum]MCJ8002403.1 TIM barrel protein [Rhizobium cremeum]
MADISFALNHMSAPQLLLPAFFDLARKLGTRAVEIRNDLEGNAILDGTPAADIRKLAEDRGLTILSINALQRFNEWTPEREEEAKALADYARDCGARALVLVPVNDGSGRADGERQANLRKALKGLQPILADTGIGGLVEPLGFPICSLRSKREAVEAINELGFGASFRLVHDTFHHYLAGEPEFYPAQTGLVHISGVTDKAVGVDDMLDAHRVLVDSEDRLGNIGQIRTLREQGYSGFFSFEPFASSVHELSDPAEAVARSIEFIRAGI